MAAAALVGALIGYVAGAMAELTVLARSGVSIRAAIRGALWPSRQGRWARLWAMTAMGVLAVALVMLEPDGRRVARGTVIAAIVLIAALVDVRLRRIPNGLIIVGALTWPVWVICTDYPPSSALAAVALFLAFGLSAIVSRGAFGMGDVKLVFVIALLVGWPETAVALILAFLVGAAVSLVGMASGRIARKDKLPFAPFLAVGTWCALLWSRPLVEWYCSLWR